MIFPAPGIEPGPAGWEPAILATRPCRICWSLMRNFLNSRISYCYPELRCHKRSDGTLPTTAVRKNLDCKNLSPLNVTWAFPLFPLPVADLCKYRAYVGEFHEVSVTHALQLNLLEARNLEDVMWQPTPNIFPMPSCNSTDAISRLGSAAAECHHFFPASLPNLCSGIDGDLLIEYIYTNSGLWLCPCLWPFYDQMLNTIPILWWPLCLTLASLAICQ